MGTPSIERVAANRSLVDSSLREPADAGAVQVASARGRASAAKRRGFMK